MKKLRTKKNVSRNKYKYKTKNNVSKRMMKGGGEDIKPEKLKKSFFTKITGKISKIWAEPKTKNMKTEMLSHPVFDKFHRIPNTSEEERKNKILKIKFKYFEILKNKYNLNTSTQPATIEQIKLIVDKSKKSK